MPHGCKTKKTQETGELNVAKKIAEKIKAGKLEAGNDEEERAEAIINSNQRTAAAVIKGAASSHQPEITVTLFSPLSIIFS